MPSGEHPFDGDMILIKNKNKNKNNNNNNNNAMELFQAREMERYTAAGRAEEYRVKEWMGRYLESATRSNAVGYWGGDEWYMRDPGDWWW